MNFAIDTAASNFRGSSPPLEHHYKCVHFYPKRQRNRFVPSRSPNHLMSYEFRGHNTQLTFAVTCARAAVSGGFNSNATNGA